MPLQGWMFFEGSFFFKNLCLTFNKCFHDNGKKKTMLSLHFFSIIHLCLLSNFVLGCLPLCLAYNRSSISICEMNVWSTIGTSGRYTLLILLYYILQCGKYPNIKSAMVTGVVGITSKAALHCLELFTKLNPQEISEGSWIVAFIIWVQFSAFPIPSLSLFPIHL